MAGHIGSPHTAEEFEHFYRVEKEVGRALNKQRNHDFPWKEVSCFFLLGSVIAGYESSPFWSAHPIFGFCLLNFLHFPLLHKMFF